ncbi:MAG: DUF2147 domain-containing protein [Pseudomonadales bacterium]
MKTLPPIILLLLAAGAAQASPIGLWKTIDDASQEETAIVRIVERDGALVGEITAVLDQSADPNEICSLCTDERRNAPIVGLTIIRNVEPNDKPTGPWDGGDILDPNNGKVYKLRLKLADGGRKLEVRGYIGRPMFGRTQVWHRVE